MSLQSISGKRYRSPLMIITHAVWLYCRFNLRLREIEELFLEFGIDVSYANPTIGFKVWPVFHAQIVLQTT